MTKATSHLPVKVALVEDHPQFREELTRALTASSRFQLIAVCRDLPCGLEMLEKQQPDVLLVDLALPSGRGLPLIRSALSRWGNRCTSAVVTMTGDENHLMEAVSFGAKGYLFKSDQPASWLDAIEMLAKGESPVHSTFAQRMFLGLADRDADQGHPASDLLQYIASGYTLDEAAEQLKLDSPQAGRLIRLVYDNFLVPAPELSPRELELLSLLNRGYTFRLCAELMEVKESTTKTQAGRAYQKLGATNLQMALYEARMAGLIS